MVRWCFRGEGDKEVLKIKRKKNSIDANKWHFWSG